MHRITVYSYFHDESHEETRSSSSSLTRCSNTYIIYSSINQSITKKRKE